MNAFDVVNLYNELNEQGIEVWIDGGWGVDALLGHQTRPHEDVDIVIQQKDVPLLRQVLETQGYNDVPRNDTSVWNFVLGDSSDHLVDIHAVVFDNKRNGLYGPTKEGIMYPAASLTGNGTINGQSVRCMSAEYMVKFHTGYQLDENDYKDVSALCEKFGIEYPEEYRRKKREFTP